MTRKRFAALAVALLVIALALGLAAVQTMSSHAASEASPAASPSAGTSAYEYMAELSDGIGARVTGTAAEAQAAALVGGWFTDLGYQPSTQVFSFDSGGKATSSQNIVAVKAGTSSKRIVIGAHLDSAAKGRGAFDNASGVALMMQLADALRAEVTPYTLVFVAFGAEEAGGKGSSAYFKSLTSQEKADTVLMVNFDSVNAGDELYAYSSTLQSWPQLALRSMARQMGTTILTNPGLNKSYPYGSTGDWSDHAVFARNGIPYLYLESTNWLLGKKDGYVNSARWGEIWHSKHDTISWIEQRLPGRMQAQFEAEFAVFAKFLTTYTIQQ